MTDTDLHSYFENFVRTLRARGVVCAITSGMACVHYGVAETTKDCDLLCHPCAFSALLDLLVEAKVDGHSCHYRGSLSPPLDARWHQGGWTSHFEWEQGPGAVTLDVFGHAWPEPMMWAEDVIGLYAGAHTVAAMKRTSRDKDWPFIDALGVRMIEAGDERGWLHIYKPDTLTQLLEENTCPSELAARRPALALAIQGDPRAVGALRVERLYWEELARKRMRILHEGLRPYHAAVRKERPPHGLPLREDHALRLTCAEQFLTANPLGDYGLDKYIEETKATLCNSGLLSEVALNWLPDVMVYFNRLNR